MHQCDDDVSPDGLQSSPLSLTSQAKGDHNGVHYHHHQNKVVDSSFCRENDEEDEKDAETPIFRGFDQAGDGADHIVAVSSGHSHGHGHAHAHSVPTSVAAVAWMVILGRPALALRTSFLALDKILNLGSFYFHALCNNQFCVNQLILENYFYFIVNLKMFSLYRMLVLSAAETYFFFSLLQL